MPRISLAAICCLAGLLVLMGPRVAYPNEFKVLVVMSYERDYPWVVDIRKGIESLMADSCRIDYCYLNTKTDWNGGPRKAREAFDQFRQLNPDGVIVADDDAQVMFVLPYLKDRVKTPVIFCGVNADPATYGYPASNVTGVLESEPMQQSLLFLRQLVPTVTSFGLITKDSPTAKAVENQLDREKNTYSIKYVGAWTVKDLRQAEQSAAALSGKCDALLYITMEGLPDKQGQPLTDRQILPLLVKSYGKPVITNAMYRVRYGALCAVVKTGQEHGMMAAEMLFKAMRGTPVARLPMTRNRYGKRVINVDKLVELGIKPDPMVIRSATLVRTEK